VTDLIARVRNLALDLRPTLLDDFGLSAALEACFNAFGRR
jgi:signal transduction histidine kinase